MQVIETLRIMCALCLLVRNALTACCIACMFNFIFPCYIIGERGYRCFDQMAWSCPRPGPRQLLPRRLRVSDPVLQCRPNLFSTNRGKFIHPLRLRGDGNNCVSYRDLLWVCAIACTWYLTLLLYCRTYYCLPLIVIVLSVRLILVLTTTCY